MHGPAPNSENIVLLEEAVMSLSPKLVWFHGPTPSNPGSNSLPTRLLLFSLSLHQPPPRAHPPSPLRRPITYFLEHPHLRLCRHRFCP
ncbi:hypothetical protein Fmac_025789 [Flemingia macrophylla]|uniref:Uncharacterized protein n=1 Tax=Flemingia macrophylla TaxID=520843 RepID=A0ABD1LT81_9FABA